MATSNNTVLRVVLGSAAGLVVAFIAWLRAIVWGHEKRITRVEVEFKNLKEGQKEIKRTQTRAFEVMEKGFERLHDKLEARP